MSFKLGLPNIDRNYHIEEGNVFLLEAVTKTNYDRFIQQMIEKNKDDVDEILYVTTHIDESIIADRFDKSDIVNTDITFIDLSNLQSEEKVAELKSRLSQEKQLVIVDKIDVFEGSIDEETYIKLLNYIIQKIQLNNGLMIYVAMYIDKNTDTLLRNRKYTRDISDAVCSINIKETESETKPFLRLHKNRSISYRDFGNKIYPIKFKDDSVNIDTSRDIA